jgi:hypothetical protein
VAEFTDVEDDLDTSIELDDDAMQESHRSPHRARQQAPRPPPQDPDVLLDKLAAMQRELNRLREMHNGAPASPSHGNPKSPIEIASELTWDEGGMSHVSFDSSTPNSAAVEPKIPHTVTAIAAATPTKRASRPRHSKNDLAPPAAEVADHRVAAVPAKSSTADRRRRKQEREEEKRLLARDKAERKRKTAAESAERKEKLKLQQQYKKELIKSQKAELKFRKALLKQKQAEIKMLSRLDPALLQEEIRAREADARRAVDRDARRIDQAGSPVPSSKFGPLSSVGTLRVPQGHGGGVARHTSATEADRPAPKRRPAQRRFSLASAFGSFRLRRRRSLATSPAESFGGSPSTPPTRESPVAHVTAPITPPTSTTPPPVGMRAPPSASRIPRASILRAKSGTTQSAPTAVAEAAEMPVRRSGARETKLDAAAPLKNLMNPINQELQFNHPNTVQTQWAAPSARGYPPKSRARTLTETAV